MPICNSLLLSTALALLSVCSIILLFFPLLSYATVSSGNTSVGNNTTAAMVNNTMAELANATITAAQSQANATITAAQSQANATITAAQSQANATITAAQSQANATITRAELANLPASIGGMLAIAIILILAIPI